MARGIKVERNAKGSVKSVTIRANTDDEDVQDLIDLAVVKAAKSQPRTPWETVKKELAKKHGWKNV